MAGLRSLITWFDRRRRLVLVLLVAWAVVIGTGAGPQPAASRWVGLPPFEEALLIIGVVYAVLAVLAFIVMLFVGRRGSTELPERKPMWPMIILLVVLILISNRLAPDDRDRDQTTSEPVAAEPEEAGRPRDTVLGAGELAVLAGVAATAVGAIIWTRRRIRADGRPPIAPPLAPDLEPLLDDAIERLEAGGDPRSAVLAAYAGFERAMVEWGDGRDRSETPTEYVARILDRYPLAAEVLGRLAGLYEVARFSDHPVTAADRRQAGHDLRRLRTDLMVLASAGEPEPA